MTICSQFGEKMSPETGTFIFFYIVELVVFSLATHLRGRSFAKNPDDEAFEFTRLVWLLGGFYLALIVGFFLGPVARTGSTAYPFTGIYLLTYMGSPAVQSALIAAVAGLLTGVRSLSNTHTFPHMCTDPWDHRRICRGPSQEQGPAHYGSHSMLSRS